MTLRMAWPLLCKTSTLARKNCPSWRSLTVRDTAGVLPLPRRSHVHVQLPPPFAVVGSPVLLACLFALLCFALLCFADMKHNDSPTNSDVVRARRGSLDMREAASQRMPQTKLSDEPDGARVQFFTAPRQADLHSQRSDDSHASSVVKFTESGGSVSTSGFGVHSPHTLPVIESERLLAPSAENGGEDNDGDEEQKYEAKPTPVPVTRAFEAGSEVVHPSVGGVGAHRPTAAARVRLEPMQGTPNPLDSLVVDGGAPRSPVAAGEPLPLPSLLPDAPDPSNGGDAVV